MRTSIILAALAAFYSMPVLAADAPAAPSGAQPVLQTVKAELNDNSKIEIDPTGAVSVLDASGNKTPAPDGTLTLKDGTPFLVKNGHMAPNN